MSRSVRTSILLGMIAALLLGYILLVDRGGITTGELEQHKGSAVPEFVRARTARIEVQRKGATTVLTRKPDDLDEGGLWRVEVPYRAKADAEAVDALLGALEYIDARRRIEHLSAEDRKRFGFDTPRYRVAVTVGKTRVPIVVGNESPRGDGIYLQASDTSQAFVVGKDLLQALDRDPNDYHAKELHDGVLVATSSEISLHDEQGERALKRQDSELWRVTTPELGLASTPTVTELINAFDALRAKHFVAEGAKDLARYGLDHPRFELTLRQSKLLGAGGAKPEPPAGAKPKRQEVTLKLRVGSACQGHPGESYAVIDDNGAVYCLLDADLTKLQISKEDLRERRLLPLEDDQVQAVRLEQNGRRLVLNKTKDQWSYEASRPGASPLKGDARSDAVSGWLKALRETKAERFEANSPAAALHPEAFALHIERSKDKAAYEIRVDGSRIQELAAERPGEPQSLLFAQSARALLEPTAARFRKLALLSIDESALRMIEVRRGGELERLGRPSKDASFTVEAPVHAPSDGPALAELTRLICSLAAVRFVADERKPEFGLDPASATITLRSERKDGQAQQAILRLGAAAEDGRYAELDGERGVFIVSAQLAQQVAEPLVSRTLLSTPLERILALELTEGAQHLSIQRKGDNFSGGDGSTLSAQAAESLAETLATLRAAHVTGYAPATAAEALNPPRARITVNTKSAPGGGSESYTIAIGGTAALGGSYARRDDLAVGFVLPADSVSRLLAPLEAK